MTFVSPSETESELSPSHAALPLVHLAGRIRRRLPTRLIRFELLSWGFPKIPLHRDPDRASTPGRSPALRHEDANLVHVPPLPFLPASTVYSARPPQVCCTLHPIMGFGPFQAPPPVHLAAAPTISTFPETALHTLQSLPLDHSRTASPRPLPSHRSSAPRMKLSDPKAFLRCRVRCRIRRCRRLQPDALLGFVPLQGPPRILRDRCPRRPESLVRFSTLSLP